MKMKLARILPEKLFKPRKARSVARCDADPASFSSEASSSSSSEDVLKKPNGSSTPTTVLPSADLYSELKQSFETIDRDGGGRIEWAELERLLCRLGAEPLSEEELKLMPSEVGDGDGCVSLEEFYAFAPPACGGELRDTFEFFDSDGDGRITAEELFEAFETIGGARCTLDECRRMIRGVDSNGDGFVCFEDFTRMMEPHQI